MSRNKMAFRFEVALGVEKQDLTTSVQEKRNFFPNPISKIIIFIMIFKRTMKKFMILFGSSCSIDEDMRVLALLCSVENEFFSIEKCLRSIGDKIGTVEFSSLRIIFHENVRVRVRSKMRGKGSPQPLATRTIHSTNGNGGEVEILVREDSSTGTTTTTIA